MTELAILIIGLLAGILLAAVGVSVAGLVYLARQVRQESKLAHQRMLAVVAANTRATQQLQQSVTLALSSMDANRLQESSHTIQHSVKQLNQTVGALSKLVFAAGSGDAGMDLSLVEALNEQQDDRSIPVIQEYEDPFARWRRVQEEKGRVSTGNDFSARPPGPLPDLEQGFLEDLHDPLVMSDADLPGISEPSDNPLKG